MKVQRRFSAKIVAGAGADFLLLLDGVVDVGEAALAAVLTIEMSRLLKQQKFC